MFCCPCTCPCELHRHEARPLQPLIFEFCSHYVPSIIAAYPKPLVSLTALPWPFTSCLILHRGRYLLRILNQYTAQCSVCESTKLGQRASVQVLVPLCFFFSPVNLDQ